MNKTILALLLLGMLSACKKTDKNSLKKEETDEVVKVEISVSRLKDTPSNTDPQGDPTYNLLGYGYDITDKHASTGSVRAKVIDVPLFVTNHSGAFTQNNSTEGFPITFNGVSAEDLSGKLSEQYDVSKGLNVFKSTIVSSFPENDALSRKYGYGYFSGIFIRKRLRIEAAEGRNSLTLAFTQDIKTLSAEQLVKKYGTHILQRIHIGTRINAIYQSEVPDNSERKFAVREGLEYAMNKVFGVFPSNGGDFNIKALNTNSSVKLRYEVIGGDPGKIKELDIAGIKRVNTNEWSNSISESDYRFIDFEKNGLIPLHELIVDDTKKTEVKDFITKYIFEHQVQTKE